MAARPHATLDSTGPHLGDPQQQMRLALSCACIGWGRPNPLEAFPSHRARQRHAGETARSARCGRVRPKHHSKKVMPRQRPAKTPTDRSMHDNYGVDLGWYAAA